MYEKIICKNGKIILLSDISKKVSDINDLILIDLANIENEIEQIEKQKDSYINHSKKCIKNLKIYKICKNFTILLTLMGIVTAFVLNAHILYFFSMFSLMYIGFFMFGIKTLSKELKCNELVIEILNNYKQDLLIKKEQIKLNPTLSPIREGQEFELKEGIGLGNAFRVLRAYYKKQDLVNRMYKNSIDLKKDISQNFSIVFDECSVDHDYRDIVIEEIYKNIIKERKLIKEK